MTLDYSRDGRAITYSKPLSAGHTLTFAAQEIRRERGNTHATIAVKLDGVTAAWHDLNIRDAEKRNWLANQAHKDMLRGQANGLATELPDHYMRKELSDFCMGLWDEHVSEHLPEELDGEEDPQPPEFFAEPYILKDGGTIFFGPPGRGKSQTLLLLAISIDAGVAKYFPVPEPAKVLFVNLERSRQSIRNRLGRLNRVLGLSPGRTLLTFSARGKSLVDVVPAIARVIEEKGVQLIMLDSISRAGLGDLNENAAGNKIIDALNAFGLPWFAIGHTPRGDETHVYGSIMFDAGADITVQLLSQQMDDGTLGVGLAIVKENDIGKRPTRILAYEFDRAGLSNVRAARPGEFPDIEQGRQPSLPDLIRDYLADMPNAKATATEIAKGLGKNRSAVSSALSTSKLFVRLERAGRDQYYGLAGLTQRDQPIPF